MATVCYSCKKKIRYFKPRGTSKFIIRAGYKPPDGMTEKDNLCKDCLHEIKTTQIQGQRMNMKASMTWQMIFVILPVGLLHIWAFHRIDKLTRAFLYSCGFIAVSLALLMIPYYFDSIPDMIKSGLWISGGIILLLLYIMSIFWIYDWTKAYNKTAI